MKYNGTQKSGVDKDVDVYVFTLGKLEARLLVDLLKKFTNNVEGLFEISPVKQRAKTMIRELTKNVPLTTKKGQHTDK